MRTAVKYGTLLAAAHLALSVVIVLLAREDLGWLMLFGFIDFPVAMLNISGVSPWLFESLSLPGDGGATPFMVLGTVFYAAVGVGAELGVTHWRQSRSRRPEACGNCDYDLTGNESGVCPECGTPIEASER